MAEEEQAQKEKSEEKSSDKSIVEKAQEVYENLTQQITTAELQLERIKAAKVEALLSGTADAGTAPVEKKEETPQEYAKRIMAGEYDG